MQPVERIAARILVLRGQRVLIDSDLAPDFMFQLTDQELVRLMSQIATSKPGRGGMRKPPPAFTEHGAIMAATVLNSRGAIEISVFVVRAFVRMREMIAGHREIGKRLDELEREVGTHDQTIAQILAALRELTQPAAAPRRRVGFV